MLQESWTYESLRAIFSSNFLNNFHLYLKTLKFNFRNFLINRGFLVAIFLLQYLVLILAGLAPDHYNFCLGMSHGGS